MNITDMLGEYMSDYALAMTGYSDFNYEPLKGATVAVDGESDFLVNAVCLSLLGLNEDKKLSMKVILLGRKIENDSLKSRSDFFSCLHSELKSADYIISTGICGKPLGGGAEEYLKVLDRTAETLKTAASIKPKRFILLSDYRVYGKHCGNVVVSENEAGFTEGSSTDTVQAISLSVEEYTSFYAKQYGLKTVTLRSGILLGADAELVPNFTDDIFSAVASGEQTKLVRSRKKYSFTYLSDLLYAVLFSFYEFVEDNAYNIVSRDATVSTGIFAAMIADLYPDTCKIEIINSENDPHYGIAMNNAKALDLGCEPQLSLNDIIQLMVCFKKDKDKTFNFMSSHMGKIDDIQRILVGYLLEIDRICLKHNIKYFLGGGTLLGAVRHGSFIPWDDDIDIMMLREDYDKFLEVAAQELPKGLSLQTTKTDKYCHYPFAKIRIDDTMFATKFSKNHSGMNNGMAFDVFAHDVTANSKIGQKLHLQFTLLIRSMIFNKWNKRKIDNRHKFQSFVANVLKAIFPIRFSEWIQYRVFKMFKHKKNAKYLYDGMGRNIRRGAFPISYLDEVDYAEIFDHKFPIPKEYDKYLTYLYGDYMKPVPPAKRQPSHAIVLMDLAEFLNYKPRAKKD